MLPPSITFTAAEAAEAAELARAKLGPVPVRHSTLARRLEQRGLLDPTQPVFGCCVFHTALKDSLGVAK